MRLASLDLVFPVLFPSTERCPGQEIIRHAFTTRREPLSLINLKKRNVESGEEELASRLDHYKAKATRHIFLIRHSQYNVDGSLEKDRTLTPLGRIPLMVLKLSVELGI